MMLNAQQPNDCHPGRSEAESRDPGIPVIEIKLHRWETWIPDQPFGLSGTTT
jgi:hypothetical protein